MVRMDEYENKAKRLEENGIYPQAQQKPIPGKDTSGRVLSINFLSGKNQLPRKLSQGFLV